MKIEITATCIIDNEEGVTLDYYNANNGEVAFEVLAMSGEDGNNSFKIKVEEVVE